MDDIKKLKIVCCQCGKEAESIIYFKDGVFSVCDNCLNERNLFSALFKGGLI